MRNLNIAVLQTPEFIPAPPDGAPRKWLLGSTFDLEPCGLDYAGGVVLRRQVQLLVHYTALSPSAQRVFLALWSLMRPDGIICPTREDIGELAEMGTRQVDRLKRELEENHVLTWHNRIRIQRQDGRVEVVQTSNCYKLRLPPCGYVSPALIERKKEERADRKAAAAAQAVADAESAALLAAELAMIGPRMSWEMTLERLQMMRLGLL